MAIIRKRGQHTHRQLTGGGSPEEMITLYRVGALSTKGSPTEWIRQRQEASGSLEATGRWWGIAENVPWYAREYETEDIWKLDIPASVAAQYQVTQLDPKTRRYSKRPAEEYFLPREWIEKAQPYTVKQLTGGTWQEVAPVPGEPDKPWPNQPTSTGVFDFGTEAEEDELPDRIAAERGAAGAVPGQFTNEQLTAAPPTEDPFATLGEATLDYAAIYGTGGVTPPAGGGNVPMGTGQPDIPRDIIAGYMRWGYSPEELYGVLGRAGVGAGGAEEYLAQYMERQYGPLPASMQAEEGGPMTRWQYAQYGEAQRMRMRGAVQMRPGEPMPAPGDWPAGMFTRQGARSLYPISALTGTGLFLPGEEPGTYRTPIPPEKLAKRMQLAGVYEGMTVYDPSGRSRMVRAPMRAGPGAEVPERGFVMRAAVPLVQLGVSGTSLVSPAAVGMLGSRRTVDVPIPQGVTPTGVPETGTTWGPNEFIPFTGAEALRFGDWTSVQFLGAERAGDVMRYTFERYADPRSNIMEFKSFFTKTTAPVARSEEEFRRLVGGLDVEALIELKEAGGLPYSMAMAQPGLAGETWQGIGAEYIEALRQRLPGMVQDVSYPITMHQSAFEQVPAATRERVFESVREEGEMRHITTKPIPTLVADVFMQAKRGYPWTSPRIPYRELERIRLSDDPTYQRIMEESQPIREAYGGLLSAAYATATGQELAGAVQVTPEAASGVLAGGREAALGAFPGAEGDISKVPWNIQVSHIMEAARAKWGTSPLQFGESQYYVSPGHARRFRAGGATAGSEEGAIARGLVSALTGIEASLEGGGTEGVERAMAAQREIAEGPNAVRSMLSAYLPRTATGSTLAASHALPPEMGYMPESEVMRLYGVRGGAQRTAFMRAWQAGEIQPRALGMRFPTARGRDVSMILGLATSLDLEEKYNVEHDPRTSRIVSTIATQAMSADTDADAELRKVVGELKWQKGRPSIVGGPPITARTEIEVAAQEAIQMGAANLLGEEFGSGPGTTEELQRRLDVSRWPTYTGAEIQEAMSADVALREQIGGPFNVLDIMGVTARKQPGVSEEQVGFAEKLHASVYGYRQRPARPPDPLERVMEPLTSGRTWTGGYRTEEGPGYVSGPGFGPMMRHLTTQLAGLAGKEGFSRREIAAGLAPIGASETVVGRIEASIGRYQADIGQGTSGAHIEHILKLMGGEDPTAKGYTGASALDPMRAMETLVGATALPLWYRKLQREVGRELPPGASSEDIRKHSQALREMAAMRPEVQAAAEARLAPIEAYSAALSKGRRSFVERMAGAMEEAPHMLPSTFAGLRAVTAPAEEAPAEVLGPEPAVDIAEPQAASGGRQPPGGRLPPVAAASAAVPGGETPEESYRQRVQKQLVEAEYGFSGRTVDEESADKIVKRIMGGLRHDVRPEQLEEAVKGVTEGLNEYNDIIQPLIDSGKQLNRAQQGALAQLNRYQQTLRKADLQTWQEGQPGWKDAVEARRLIEQEQGFGPAEQAAAGLRIQGMLEGFGAGGDGGFLGGLTAGRGWGGAEGWQGVAGRAIGGLGRELMSGWGMMRLRRLWGMTGGAAMGQIPTAAQYEMGAAQAAYAGLPREQYQMGGMGLDIMSYQATQQDWRAQVGRAAYGAYGWVQPSAGQPGAVGAGVLGPALGVGAIAGSLGAAAGFGAFALPLGLATAGITATVGSVMYGQSVMRNRPRTDIAAYTGIAGGRAAEWWATSMWHSPLRALFGGPTWQERREGGQRLVEGPMQGLEPQQRIEAIQYAAERATRRGQPLAFMTDVQASQMLQEWTVMTPGAEDLAARDIFADPRFERMAARGERAGPFGQIAQQWGLPPTQWQQIEDVTKGMLPSQAQEWQFAQQFYAPFARLGMTPEMAARMPTPDAQQQRFLQQLAAGSPLAWSMAGQQTGQQNLMTVSPQTGMGIGINWGGGILGGYMGQVGAAGGGVAGGMAMVGGQQVPFNQWALEDASRGIERGYQDWQFGFRMQGLQNQYAYQQQQWGFQDVGIGLQQGYQRQQFGFQQRGMDLGDQQFQERWQMQWGRMQTEAGWGREGMERQYGRAQVRFGWAEEDLAFRGAQSALRFGWQMEDLEEAERFATGRGRRQIRRQRERAAVMFGMGQGQLEEEESRLDQRREWAEEDHETAREQFDQRQGWREEELELQREHHEERLDLSQDRLDASVEYFEETSKLQEQQREASRDYWEENYDRQVESLEKEKEFRGVVREAQDAQLALSRAQQLHLANFRREFEQGSLLDITIESFFDRLGASFQEAGREAQLYITGRR